MGRVPLLDPEAATSRIEGDGEGDGRGDGDGEGEGDGNAEGVGAELGAAVGALVGDDHGVDGDGDGLRTSTGRVVGSAAPIVAGVITLPTSTRIAANHGASRRPRRTTEAGGGKA